MTNNKFAKGFSSEVIERLQSYVYRLIDPRNGETFYVGRGKGNRVFAHIRDALKSEDPADRLSRIRDIRLKGFEVSHIIHRHGLNEQAAREVEAALIDAYPGLTNIANGAGSNEYGVAHANEIIKRYGAEPAAISHRVLFISVNQTVENTELYEAVRYAWVIDPKRAQRAEYVLAVHRGLIVGAYQADEWLPATREHFPDREPVEDRWGFRGSEAPDKIRKLYVGKRMPEEYRKRGAANPIKYSYR